MNAVAGTAGQLALFTIATWGLGAACAPAAPRAGRAASAPRDPLGRLSVGLIVAMAAWFVGGFAGFALGCSNRITAAALGAAAAGFMLWRARAIRALWREPEVRPFAAAWLIFAVWSIGLLALVSSYSGGGWVADWVEHWQRTVFFFDRQPLNTTFAAVYPLTARPPLANLVVALWLAATGLTFAHFQVFLTLLGSLVLLPAWMLARRWSSRANAGWWVTLVLMLNPMVAENLTFAWTKLATAFFVLTAVALALAGLTGGHHRTSRAAAAASLGLAMLTHYSAGPWIIALAAGYLAARRSEWRSSGFWREIAALTAIAGVLLAIWVGWAVAHFGWRGTLAANSTTASWGTQTPAQHVLVPVRNLVDTLVPFPLRGEPHDGLIAQPSRWGHLRDAAFNVYQVNLPLALGLSGLWVLAVAAIRRRRPATRGRAAPHRFLAVSIPLAIVLGVVVHTPRDRWGLAHICLQPAILLGLAAVAALLSAAPAPRRWIWAAFVAVDAGLGIALQFGIESGALARWIDPARPGRYLQRLNRAALANAADKAAFHFRFLADELHLAPAALATALALCLGAVILRVRSNLCPPGGL